MKYMLLAYTGMSGWDELDVESPEFQAVCDFYVQLGKELTETGELVLTEGLTNPAIARTVRRGESGPVVTDGPFAEAKEVLASFSILDCASIDRATEIARRITEVVGDEIEIRPVVQDITTDL